MRADAHWLTNEDQERWKDVFLNSASPYSNLEIDSNTLSRCTREEIYGLAYCLSKCLMEIPNVSIMFLSDWGHRMISNELMGAVVSSMDPACIMQKNKESIVIRIDGNDRRLTYVYHRPNNMGNTTRGLDFNMIVLHRLSSLPLSFIYEVIHPFLCCFGNDIHIVAIHEKGKSVWSPEGPVTECSFLTFDSNATPDRNAMKAVKCDEHLLFIMLNCSRENFHPANKDVLLFWTDKGGDKNATILKSVHG